jgi:hypothetical protein
MKNYLIRHSVISLCLIIPIAIRFFFPAGMIAQNDQVAKEETEYKVQVMAVWNEAYSPLLIQTQYELDTLVREDYHKGWYKYSVGSFEDYYSARNYREKLRRDYGVKGAFVVFFYKNKRVTTIDSAEYYEEQAKKNALQRLLASSDEQVRDSLQFDTIIYPKDTAPITIMDTTIRDVSPVAGKVEDVGPEEKSSIRTGSFRTRLINFFNRQFPVSISIWLEKIVNITYTKLIALIFVILIIYLLLNVILVSIFVIINNIRRSIRVNRQKKLREQYQGKLTNFLLTDERTFKEVVNLARIRKRGKRQILSGELLNLQSNVSGEANKKLSNLYYALQLDRDSLRKLKRLDWIIKTKGLTEISQMDVKRAIPRIDHFLNVKNDVLRSEAQLALVRLNVNDPFSFLDRLTKFFTQWEQLHIHTIVKRHKIIVPDFSRWFDSKNDSVVIFAVKMATIYYQTLCGKALVELLSHPNTAVRNIAIQAIGLMGLQELDKQLMQIYADEDYQNKLAIIKSLQQIPDGKQIEFLTDVISGRDFNLQLEAARALYNMGKSGKERLKKLEMELNGDFKKIIKHISDNRI